VRGVAAEVRTDAAGRFTLVVPSGPVDVTFVHAAYAPSTLRDVLVAAQATTQLEVELLPAAIELEQLLVSAPRIVGSTLDALAERQAAAAVGEIIGAQQMSRSGDSNAASALKRATGVTIVDGRFVYVRGLGERYSSTLLDGAQLPSPEPERRVVPLDMFPAGLLEGIAIQKGYTPDMPGEFGGGVVQIRTRAFPADLEARLSIGLGARLGTTLEEQLMGASGPTDWLGVDGGHRALPDAVQAASDWAPLLERDMFSTRGYTLGELERFGELMTTDWTPTRALVPPGLTLAAQVGDGYDTGSGRAGWFAALTYGSDWAGGQRDVRIYTVGADGSLEPAHRYRFDDLEMRVALSGIVSGGLDLGDDHTLRLTSLVNRVTTDEARVYEGFNRDVATEIRVTRLQWIEQMLLTNQLRGTHVLAPGVDLAWHYALSLATRLEPDRRQVRYDHEAGTDDWRLSDRPEGNRRVFSELGDLAHDVGADVTIDVVDDGALSLSLEAGLALVAKDREVDTRRYKLDQQGPLANDEELLLLPPEELFVPAYIGADGFVLTETTLETDNYRASQLMLALYAMGELTLGEALTVVAGVRLESSEQRIGTFVPFSPTARSIEASLATLDVLPALSAQWRFAQGMGLRLGLAQTVSRPDFRELSPATYNDVTGGRQYFGNPELERALIQHADLRWEWFPSAGELLSLGVFYKHFDRPIEVVVVPSAQLSVTFENATAADNFGAELELRKDFGFVAPPLADLYLSANLALIASEIELGGTRSIQTSKSRPLQGQSPFVLNLQLGYENVDLGTHAALLYNVSGRRIVEVGALGAPDTYLEPLHQLDLVIGQKLGDGFDLTFKAQNLIDAPLDTTQGDKRLERDRRGRAFSLQLGKSF